MEVFCFLDFFSVQTGGVCFQEQVIAIWWVMSSQTSFGSSMLCEFPLMFNFSTWLSVYLYMWE